MAIGLKTSESNVFSGLGTLTYTIGAAGAHTITCTSTVNFGSGLVITINQNGSQVATTSALSTSATQQTLNLSTSFVCSVSDVVTVVLTSSAAIDSMLNTVKSIVTIGLGT